jgi:hypothetical protein
MSGFQTTILVDDRCPNCDKGELKPVDAHGEFVTKAQVGRHAGNYMRKCDYCGFSLNQPIDTRRNVRDPMRVNIPGSMW